MTLNLKLVNKISKKLRPKYIHEKNLNKSRFELSDYLPKKNTNKGLELGVAAGSFSKKMIKSKKFSEYIGVDRYAGPHKKEFEKADPIYGDRSGCKLIKGSFAETITKFDDNYFDLIYFDGFAHSGQDAGKTIKLYLPKLRNGGILAGDDFSDSWPLTKWLVLELAKKLNSDVNVLNVISDESYSQYPSWFIIVEDVSVKLDFPILFRLLCGIETFRIAVIRAVLAPLRDLKNAIK